MALAKVFKLLPQQKLIGWRGKIWGMFLDLINIKNGGKQQSTMLLIFNTNIEKIDLIFDLEALTLLWKQFFLDKYYFSPKVHEYVFWLKLFKLALNWCGTYVISENFQNREANVRDHVPGTNKMFIEHVLTTGPIFNDESRQRSIGIAPRGSSSP
jgi:hypothetical protein